MRKQYNQQSNVNITYTYSKTSGGDKGGLAGALARPKCLKEKKSCNF
jgi:hypothetical protein